MTVEDVYKEAQERMEKEIEAIKKELAKLRTGRASTSLVEGIRVECYGSTIPLNQLASISTPEPSLILIQPWDRGILENIQKAILRSELGLNPSTDGRVIRIPIPPLTEERRKELVKAVRRMAEERKIGVRNARRDANEIIKRMEKEGEISEDDSRRAQNRIQELTDKYIKHIDELSRLKEKEIEEG
jgi:ribosome recycling factor